MKRIYTILLLLVALPALAQTGVASLGGRIMDENGPIEGVTVVAIHQQTNAQYYATTDRGGWWQLPDVLPGGPYTVRIHYFGYDPLTVRNVYTYVGQNTVVDADLEAKSSYVHVDEAATALRVGPSLGGGTLPISPLGYDLVSQRIETPVVFDVRQEASLSGSAQQWMSSMGANRFHGTAYGFYGAGASPGEEGLFSKHGVGGVNVSTPLGNEDYQLFGGLQYGSANGLLSGLDALSGAARFDARFNERFRLDLSGGRLAKSSGSQAWVATGLTASLAEPVSMRLQTGWYSTGLSQQMLTSDDFTFTTGRHRLLAGVQFSHQSFRASDSTSTHGDIYVQDVVRLGRRLTLQGGVRFSFPFAFSPRLSLYYDILGDGRVVLRVGTAVYGVHGEGTVWKNLAAFDFGLPWQMKLTLEGIYGQTWRRAFHISSRNVMDTHYALTARLERPFADRAWVLASYTFNNSFTPHRVYAGFSYRMPWSQRAATSLSALYQGHAIEKALFSSAYPPPEGYAWYNGFEARLSQDFIFLGSSRDHLLQLTAYYRTNIDRTHYFLVGLRYAL